MNNINNSSSGQNSTIPQPKPHRGILKRIREMLWDKLPYFILFGFLITLTTIFLWNRIVIFVEAGEGGVLYRPLLGEGVITDRVYSEGMYILFPVNTLTRYNTRVQILRTEFDVLTNRGLPVTLKLAIRYRPIFELLGVLHQRVGPNYPNKIIIPQIESVLRKGLGKHSPEEIYTNKGLLLSKLIAQAIEEVGRKYVIVDDIIIRSVSLPHEVKRAIEKKLIEEQRFLSYTFRLQTEIKEAERKRIESKGIRDFSENLKASVTANVLRWKGIDATLKLASSPNSKIVIIGGQKDGMPLMLNAGNWSDLTQKPQQ
ncbi:MAG: prohibitin family protein [Magnetococcales bacterium]|nr:prohibitin family protein [Magnetococcales bacterium]